MAEETASPRQHGNAYNIFILVLTVISLVIIMVMMLLLGDNRPGDCQRARARIRKPIAGDVV